MTIKCILKHSTVNLPYFDLRIKGGSHEEVVFRMEVYFSDCFAMGIIILDQSFAAKIIKFYLFVGRATC